MSKRYRDRYLTARLSKRSLISSNPPKGCYYAIPQFTTGASLAKDLANLHGVRKRPFHQSSDSAIPHHGLETRVFTSQLSSLDPLFSLHLPFLNPLPSDLRGVAEELNFSDLSVCLTNHPTTNMRLPSRLIIGSGQNITAPLVGSPCAVSQTIPHRPLRNPSGFA
ncbi:hypothetical protein AVEN_115146-1 [Araneus ventricosus]|uniref:Uncharacterized protein n=1 Tax=Araneus ventricosus TaxID=182803 RepID=A0A4Y1ZXF3_ARAVE|nr:hypothetical protein AVEN_115146-1 [Araneus ventricosus]